MLIKIECIIQDCFNLWLNKYSNGIDKNRIRTSCYGNIIKIKNSYYVITCNHGIKNATSIIGHINKNTIELEVIAQSYECDLALLKIVKDIDIVVNPFNLKKKIFFDTDKIVSVQGLEDQHFYTNGITFEKEIFSMPKMPYIKICCNGIETYQGHSGSFVFNNDKIIGMLVSYNKYDHNFRIVPSNIINVFITEFLTNNKYEGLKTFIFKYDICELEDDDGTKSSGIIINNLYKINYATKNKSLKEGDIIYKINGHKIMNSEVYDSRIGIKLPFNTYIALSDKVFIEYYRYEKNAHKLKSFYPTILPIDKYRNIKIKNDNPDRFFIYKGIIFAELDIEIINLFEENNINFSKTSLSQYISNQYSIKPSITIVVFDIMENYLFKYGKYNLPYKNIDDKYKSLAIVKNINGIKITNLTFFKNKILSLKTPTIKCEFDKINTFIEI